jgi:hypothetical protein
MLRILGPKTEEQDGENYIKRNCIICNLHQIKEDEMKGRSSTHWGRYNILVTKPEAKRLLERPRRKIILKWMSNKV